VPDRPDPFEGLRLPATPLAPRPGFAAELRRTLEDALAPTDPAPAQAAATRSATALQEVDMSTTEPTAGEPAPASSPLTPYLMVGGAEAALDWYRDVLGAIETMRFVGDDGRVGHAEITIGGAHLMLADEYPELDLVGPVARGGTSVSLRLEVVDVDHAYRRAVGAGAATVNEPADQGHGNRSATITDPFGHRWILSQPIATDRAATAEAERGVGQVPSDWTVTGRRPVEPGYLTLHRPDLAAATAFYTTLFDWATETGGAGGQHVHNTHFPLGLSGPADDDPSRGTTVYFRVDDIEPYAAKVVELGGRVLSQATYESGGNAECVDDQGVRFDLYQPAPGY
jgi:uncharacterized glyoxalase superfamily protein PhnB